MSKKKGKKNVIQDFTINDCANAIKPVKTIRKSASEPTTELSWDEMDTNTDIVEETGSDGTKKFVCKPKKLQEIPIEDRPGHEYPEIIWYLISKYIKPEDVGTFARINRATYIITKNKAFWQLLYRRHCKRSPKLPHNLGCDSNIAYGLKQTVIRALFYTYDVFIKRLVRLATQDSHPHLLVNRKCISVWYSKGISYWSVFFKLKKPQLEKKETMDFIDELGNIDANPEEDTQVLQVTCRRFQEVPPLMGMTLASVSMTLAPGFRHHRLTLGFNSSPYSTKGVLPECTIILETVVATLVSDWWYPSYPHAKFLLPRQDPPLLKRNFFDEDLSCLDD